jgi:hypothetical protein
MKAVLRLLGYAWSSPYGAIGLLAGWLFWALGWVELGDWRGGALELVCKGPFANWMARDRNGRQWSGFTLGWTIFYWSSPNEVLRRHERRHVDQALVFGAFYPLVYAALLIVRGYRSHPMEMDARRAAGQPQSEE